MARYSRQQQIQTLDPQRDHETICYLLAGYEFPWDFTRALELALLRTFCVPTVARLLDRTGEFHHRPQKRYDDTGIVVSEIFKWGHSSDRGQQFLQRMNHIHSHFPIGNADYLYVLSVFIYEPVRWCDRFGWRPLSEEERLACFYFWQAVGQQMAIQGIPPTYAEFEAYNRAYEAEHFQFEGANQRVANATRQMMVGWFPAPLRPLVNQAVPTLLDPPLLRALGWDPAPRSHQQLAATALRLRSRLLRRLPPRTTTDFFVDQPTRTYPQGYTAADLGPPHLPRP